MWRRVESLEQLPQTLIIFKIMNNYTIICTELYYGQITQVVKKEDVRKECERLKMISKNAPENAYWQIEVVNNETGEIREYWNNKENTIKF